MRSVLKSQKGGVMRERGVRERAGDDDWNGEVWSWIIMSLIFPFIPLYLFFLAKSHW